MIRLSLTDDEFATLRHDLNLLQTFRRLAIVPSAPNAHLIPKVQAEMERTTGLQQTINEQIELQGEITQIVKLPVEEPPTASVLPLKRP